jgi:hypothetical protein
MMGLIFATSIKAMNFPTSIVMQSFATSIEAVFALWLLFKRTLTD